MSGNHDRYALQRFVDAQDRVYDTVLAELRNGAKRSHWIWFVFPQLRGLGRSATAQHYGISSLEEARAYLAHPVLGPRLRECARLVAATNGRSVDEIFGWPDNLTLTESEFGERHRQRRIVDVERDQQRVGLAAGLVDVLSVREASRRRS